MTFTKPGHLIAEFDKDGHLVFRDYYPKGMTTPPIHSADAHTKTITHQLAYQRQKNYLFFLYHTQKISSKQYNQQLAVLNKSKYDPKEPHQPPTPKPTKISNNFSLILYNKDDDVSIVVRCIDKEKPIYLRYRINQEALGENYHGGIKGRAKFTDKKTYIVDPKNINLDWEYIFFSDEEAYQVCKKINAGNYYNIKFSDNEKSYYCDAVACY